MAIKEFAPLYTPRNDTLINLFEITDSEQKELRTIISKDMAAERHRDRDRERRRAAGAVDRETYLEAANTKQQQAQALRAQGLSVRAIAEQLGISKTAVGRYIQT
ncbi:helix-turn-helix domain-containing protein [Nitrosomonas cryotolerans]|uniref:helix-turn-helix domain-containing protein n=1 Tax=Nitrosomonas cryotolerans TaxID=44575 RepID=UPI0015BFCB06|nr:helix-turn-helix domain-containing protein [Nitrosomonas cryotolerans]